MHNIISKRLKDLLNMRGISISEFAEMCELPIETVKNIYYARTADPKVSTLLKMSNVLNLTVNCLMGQCPHTKDEQALLNFFRSCGSHGKSLILLTAKYEAITAKGQRESFTKRIIPCLLTTGNVHEGIVYDQCEVVEIETTKTDAYIAIKVSTNDLAPKYCKDDILLIENRFPKNKEYAVFFMDGKIYIRQFIEDEKEYRLHCIHGIHEDIVLKRMDEIEYVGTCIDVIRS